MNPFREYVDTLESAHMEFGVFQIPESISQS